jgi:hypothetical protein
MRSPFFRTAGAKCEISGDAGEPSAQISGVPRWVAKGRHPGFLDDILCLACICQQVAREGA